MGDRLKALVSAACALLTAACVGDNREPPTRVWNHADTVELNLQQARIFRPAVEPDRVIGADEPEVSFGLIASAFLVDDGTVWVADRMTATLLRFGPQAGPPRRVGSFGSGPGEFRDIAWSSLCGGSQVHAFDPAQRRVEVFDIDGAHAATYSSPIIRAGFLVLDSGCGDSLLLGVATKVEPLGQDGPSRPPGAIIVGPLGSDRPSFSTAVPGSERVQLLGRTVGPRPLGTTTLAVASAGWLFWATGDDSRIFGLAIGSDSAVVFDPGRARRALDEDAVERYIAAQLVRRSRTGRDAEALRKQLAGTEWPDSLPSYDAALPGSDGKAWFRFSRLPGDSVGEWLQVDVRRRGSARLVTDSRFEPLSFSGRGNLVVGKWEDAMGVESVRIYRLLEVE